MTGRPPLIPVRDGSRDGSRAAPPAPAGRPCPVCRTGSVSARARYCSAACKQRAYRERQADRTTPQPAVLRYRHTAEGGVLVPSAGRRVAHTLYECPACGERSLGEQRCPDCQRFCRRLGLGGLCPHCDEPITLAELLGEEVPAAP